MSSAKKFLFDRSFDAPDPAVLIEQAKKEAFEFGKQAGLEEALTSNAVAAKDLLVPLQDRVEELKQLEREHWKNVEKEAATIAAEAFRAAFPRAGEMYGFDELIQAIQNAFDVFHEQNVRTATIYVGQDYIDQMKTFVTSLGDQVEFSVKADPLYGPGDCRIDWSQGGIEKLSAYVYEQIMLALARAGAPHDKMLEINNEDGEEPHDADEQGSDSEC